MSYCASIVGTPSSRVLIHLVRYWATLMKEATHLSLHDTNVESDYFSALQWGTGRYSSSSRLADVAKEVRDLKNLL